MEENTMYLYYHYEWYVKLQETLQKSIEEVYQGRWKDTDNKGLAADIVYRDFGEIFKVQKVEYAEQDGELRLYALIGDNVHEKDEVREIVYHVLSVTGESYCVLVPLYMLNELHFWFMTGCESHGHRGRVIITRKDNPHVNFDSPY